MGGLEGLLGYAFVEVILTAAIVCYTVFAGNFYGVLLAPERRAFLAEARRVGTELVILETSLAARREYGEGFQERTLSDGSRHAIYRKYFSTEDLSRELGETRVLFSGDHFVLMTSS